MVRPANFGHFFTAIDPELFMPSPEFTARVDRLIEQTKTGDRAEAVEEIRFLVSRSCEHGSGACARACRFSLRPIVRS